MSFQAVQTTYVCTSPNPRQKLDGDSIPKVFAATKTIVDEILIKSDGFGNVQYITTKAACVKYTVDPQRW